MKVNLSEWVNVLKASSSDEGSYKWICETNNGKGEYKIEVLSYDEIRKRTNSGVRKLPLQEIMNISKMFLSSKEFIYDANTHWISFSAAMPDDDKAQELYSNMIKSLTTISARSDEKTNQGLRSVVQRIFLLFNSLIHGDYNKQIEKMQQKVADGIHDKQIKKFREDIQKVIRESGETVHLQVPQTLDELKNYLSKIDRSLEGPQGMDFHGLSRALSRESREKLKVALNDIKDSWEKLDQK